MTRIKFQFTHPGRGATIIEPRIYDLIKVSIHAPREGCDDNDAHVEDVVSEVSIHAPREGCDQ